jgi:hypothetical protein
MLEKECFCHQRQHGTRLQGMCELHFAGVGGACQWQIPGKCWRREDYLPAPSRASVRRALRSIICLVFATILRHLPKITLPVKLMYLLPCMLWVEGCSKDSRSKQFKTRQRYFTDTNSPPRWITMLQLKIFSVQPQSREPWAVHWVTCSIFSFLKEWK